MHRFLNKEWLNLLNAGGRTQRADFWLALLVIALAATLSKGIAAVVGPWIADIVALAMVGRFIGAFIVCFLAYAFVSLLIRRARDGGLDGGFVLAGLVASAVAAALMNGKGLEVGLTLALAAVCVIGNLPERGAGAGAGEPAPQWQALRTPMTASLCAAAMVALWGGPAPAPPAPPSVGLPVSRAVAEPQAARPGLEPASGRELLAYSQACFAKAKDVKAVEACIRFDRLAWSPDQDAKAAIAYFGDGATSRHIAALAAATDSEEKAKRRYATLTKTAQ